ncbi:MAG TPA: response regulator, partial [Longimicrobium sp.]|nr:response regulator [Longimicrobium sp.]
MTIDPEIRDVVRVARPEAAVPRPALVLVADDQEWSARAFESVLGPGGFAVLRCASARQVLEQVRFVVPDLLLVKNELADGGGAALLEALRDEGRLPASTPIFVTSGAPLTRADRLAVLRAGAWDVIHLPLDAEELVVRLGTMARARFEADLARRESLLDPETGLYSVHGLLRRVRELGHQALRHPAPLACAVLAPEPAWSGGGAAEPGEAQIARVAALVARAARRSDVVGRVSRTEFAVLAPGTDTSAVLLLARRLADAATAEPVAEGAPALRVRIGCCAADDFGVVGMDPVELLVRA